MNNATQFEGRASRSRSKHEGETSNALCDRPSRTRDFSQRQLPTDQDYAVSTREYQTDQSSPKPAPAAAGPVLEQRKKQRQRQKQPIDVQRLTGHSISGNEVVRVGIFYEELRLGFTLVIAPLVAEVEHDAVALRDNLGARAGLEDIHRLGDERGGAEI